MNDQEHANAIRGGLDALRAAIISARKSGLTVSVPLAAAHWLDAGTPPGEPAYWVIRRDSL
jgi:hypothetical protein